MHRRTGPLRHKLCAGFYRHLSPVGRNARVHARKCVRINIRTYFRISVRTLYISCIISEVSIICDMTVTGETIRMDVKRMSHEACQIKCQNILYIFIDYTMRLCQTTCQSIYQTTSQTKCLCQTTCQSDFQETCWICQNMCQTTCHTWCQRICQNNLWNICPNVWNVWRYFIIHVRMDIRIYIYTHSISVGITQSTVFCSFLNIEPVFGSLQIFYDSAAKAKQNLRHRISLRLIRAGNQESGLLHACTHHKHRWLQQHVVNLASKFHLS